MKISKIPTDIIIVKANSTSDFLNVDLAIVNLTNDYKETLKSRISAVEKFKSDETFYNISFWDATALFYEWDDADEEREDIAEIKEVIETGDESYVYIELEDGEDIETIFTQPEKNTDCDQFKVLNDERIQYIGYTNHGSDEVWTETIFLKELTA